MQSLFPVTNNGRTFDSSQVILEVRAGKCHLSELQENGKHSVSIDKRRGKIVLSRSQDGLLHFKWVNLINNVTEDDRIIFPNDHSFRKVTTGLNRENDRVYVLRYLQGTQKLMFWFQDFSTAKDAEHYKRINDFLATSIHMNTAQSSRSTAGIASRDEDWSPQLTGLNPPTAARATSRHHNLLPIPPTSNLAAVAGNFGNLDIESILNTISATNNTSGSSILPPTVPSTDDIQAQNTIPDASDTTSTINAHEDPVTDMDDNTREDDDNDNANHDNAPAE